MSKTVRLTLEREDGALVTLDFDPEDIGSIERLTASMRDPVEMGRQLEKAKRDKDYWMDRCLEAERPHRVE